MNDNSVKNNTNSIIEKVSKVLFYCGVFLLSFIFFNIFISCFLFVCKISINKFSFFISILLSFIFNILLAKRNNDYKLLFLTITILVSILIILSSLYISGKLYDFSYDGNTYHKLAVGKMADGWNPVYQDVVDFDKVNNELIPSNQNSIWIDHYARASHVFAANTMKVTNNIESGKCINIISTITLLLFIISFVLYEKRKVLLSIFYGLTVIGCTTIMSQMFIYYIDCLTYIYFFLLIMSFFMFEKFTLFKNKDNYLIIFFIALAIGINIKFTLFVYDGLFCLGYYIWYIYRLKKKQIDAKFFKKFTITAAISVIVAIFVIGLAVYPKNMINHGNPFYPLMGKDSVDIMTNNQPSSFKNKLPIEKFIIATFSKADNIYDAFDRNPEFKVPFTVDAQEISFASTYDLRMSGNGLLFSGIFIICLLLFSVYIYKLYKKDKNLFFLIIIPTIITIFFILLLGESWWARYFPQLHLIVFFTLLIFIYMDTKYANRFFFILIAIIFINNYISFISSLNRSSTFYSEMKIKHYQLADAVNDDKCNIQVYSGPYEGSLYNLRYNIKDKFMEIIDDNEYLSNFQEFNDFLYIKWRCK